MNWKEQISAALDRVEGTGRFATQGDCRLPDPGLVVDGVGPVALPLRASQVRKLIAVARQAPFGKGVDTVVDTSVRRCWEMDPDQFQLTADTWPEIERILAGGVAYELGFEVPLFDASLYRLLIYEKGSFFLPHQDGEKVDSMVATLVVSLPGSFSGGELVIEHEGHKVVCPHTGAATGDSASYAAFYSDCRHEVRRLESGYRVCLVYNLSINKKRAHQAGVRQNLGASTHSRAAEDLSELFARWQPSESAAPMIALPLEHQYSPAGLSLETLKGSDRARAAAVARAADAQDLVAHVCLLTWHQHGGGSYANGHWPVHDRYSRRSWWSADDADEFEDDESFEEDDEDSDARFEEESGELPPVEPSPYVMEEVFEEEMEINHWLDLATGQRVEIGAIPITPEAMVDAGGADAWRRTKEEFEGYTGNAGMTLERWYSRAAIVLWPRREHYRILCEAGTGASLGGLQAMVAAARARRGRRRQTELEQCASFARKIIQRWEAAPRFSVRWPLWRDEETPRVDALTLFAQLEDADLVNEFLAGVAAEDEQVDLTGLPEVGRRFGWQANAEALHQVFRSDQPASLSRNLRALLALAEDDDRSTDKTSLVAGLAEAWFAALKQHDSQKAMPRWSSERLDRREVLVGMIQVGLLTGQHETLHEFLAHSLANKKKYDLREDQLTALQELQPLLQVQEDLSPLVPWLSELRGRLEALTAKPPSQPKTYRRAANVDCSCGDCRRLAEFLRDPKADKLELPLASERRRHLHSQIDFHRLDVTHQTRRQGRPYVLVCEKTRASHERAVATYHEDLRRLQLVELELRGT